MRFQIKPMSVATVGCSQTTAAISPFFEVSLLYQDLPTALHARQFLSHVLDHCELTGESRLSLWKLDLFHLPEVCEQAVAAACGAALVVLSLRGDVGLQPSTEDWLIQWIHRREDEEAALAVLIDCNMQALDSMGDTLFRLQNITRPSHVRLFVGFLSSAPAKGASPLMQESADSDPLLFSIPHPSVASLPLPEGGLNE